MSDRTPSVVSAPDVNVARSPGRGRGVFAVRRFEPGETIEVCPAILLSEADARTLDATRLHDYYFGWGEDGTQAAIVLGYGSLYNHSLTPNAEHRKNLAAGTLSIVAVRRIAAGEEIFICYETAKSADPPAVWFEVR
jgi:uncharacterized protein